MNPQYAVIDVETGGVDPTREPLIEVAWVLETGESVAFTLDFDIEKCHPRALKVNGWGEREFAPHVHNAGAIHLMRRDLTDRMIVASPAHFDMSFMAAWWDKATGDTKRPWGHRAVIDLKTYACATFGTLNPLKNSAIGGMLGIDDTSDHTALADAKWTAEIFRALLKINEDLHRI